MKKWLGDSEERSELWIALPLCALLMPLYWFLWPQPAPETLGYYLREMAMLVTVLLASAIARGVRLWLAASSPHEKSAASRAGAGQIVYALVYLSTVAASGVALWLFDRFVLQLLPSVARLSVIVLLGFPAFFGFAMLGLWAGGIAKGALSAPDKSRLTMRELPPPAADKLAVLPAPLRLRANNGWMKWLVIPCALISLGAWLGFALCLERGRSDEAVWAACAGLWMGLAAPFLWWQTRAPGQISATHLSPHSGQSFAWSQVARIEETRMFNLLAEGETRVLEFQSAQGKTLWILSLNDVHQDDLPALRTLLELED